MITRTPGFIAWAVMTSEWSWTVSVTSKVNSHKSDAGGDISVEAPNLYLLRPTAGGRAGEHFAGEKQRLGGDHQTPTGRHRGPDAGDRGGV